MAEYNHAYIGANLNRPDLWIESIEEVVNDSRFDIERVIPGHGDPDGRDLFQIEIDYLKAYQELYKPLRPQSKIAHSMIEKYPDWRMRGCLYMTIGPAITAADLIQETANSDMFD